MIWFYFIVVLAVIYAGLRFGWLFPRAKGIPILMYHEVDQLGDQGLMVKLTDFEAQLAWLADAGYRTLSMEDYLRYLEGKLDRAQLPDKPLLITFDDGYRGVVFNALPVLRRHGFRATLFLCSSLVDEREHGTSPHILSITELKQWTDGGMDVALHSHSHGKFPSFTDEEIARDLDANESRLRAWNIPYQRALAYPFGARPKSAADRLRMESMLAKLGIRGTFRIGNRVQPFRSRDTKSIESCRVGVRGGERFGSFKSKVLKGRPIRV